MAFNHCLDDCEKGMCGSSSSFPTHSWTAVVIPKVDRSEGDLGATQPVEQHDFCTQHRMRNTCLHMMLDEATNAGLLVWIVSLDLSKAFDRVTWVALCDALAADGISKHIRTFDSGPPVVLS